MTTPPPPRSRARPDSRSDPSPNSAVVWRGRSASSTPTGHAPTTPTRTTADAWNGSRCGDRELAGRFLLDDRPGPGSAPPYTATSTPRRSEPPWGRRRRWRCCGSHGDRPAHRPQRHADARWGAGPAHRAGPDAARPGGCARPVVVPTPAPTHSPAGRPRKPTVWERILTDPASDAPLQPGPQRVIGPARRCADASWTATGSCRAPGCDAGVWPCDADTGTVRSGVRADPRLRPDPPPADGGAAPRPSAGPATAARRHPRAAPPCSAGCDAHQSGAVRRSWAGRPTYRTLATRVSARGMAHRGPPRPVATPSTRQRRLTNLSPGDPPAMGRPATTAGAQPTARHHRHSAPTRPTTPLRRHRIDRPVGGAEGSCDAPNSAADATVG